MLKDNDSRFDFLEIGDELPEPAHDGDAARAVRRHFSPQVFIGEPGTDAGQFNAPHGVAVDNWGNIYIADTNNHRIQKITPYGDVFRFENSGRDLGQVMYPTDIAVDSLLSTYVLDAGNTRVQKFGPYLAV